MKNNNISRKSGFIFFLIMLRPPISTLFPYTTLFRSVRARNTAQQNACINNLRQLDGAKQQWEFGKKNVCTETTAKTRIPVYIRNNLYPNCPASGTYTLNAVSVDPTCSKSSLAQAHVL